MKVLDTLDFGSQSAIINLPAPLLASSPARKTDLDSIDAKIKIKLTADTTFYVSPTGNNSNDGLTNITPWQTIQYAIDFIAANYRASIYSINISLDTGSYTETLTTKEVLDATNETLQGQPRIKIIGSSLNPENYIISGFIGHSNLTLWGIEGVTLTATTGTLIVSYQKQSTLYVKGTIRLEKQGDTGTLFGFQCLEQGSVYASGATIRLNNSDGTWFNYFCYLRNGGWLNLDNATISFDLATLFWRIVFAFVAENSFLSLRNITWVNSASVTGLRFQIAAGGRINTASNNLNYIPGNAAGVFGYSGSDLTGKSGWYDFYHPAFTNTRQAYRGVAPYPYTPVIGDKWEELNVSNQFVETWFWNGSIWLSERLYYLQFSSFETISTTTNYYSSEDFTNFNFYVVALVGSFFCNNAQSGTNFWSFNIARINQANTSTSINTSNSQTFTVANNWFNFITNINTQIISATTGIKTFRLQLSRSGVGAGNASGQIKLQYRKARL